MLVYKYGRARVLKSYPAPQRTLFLYIHFIF